MISGRKGVLCVGVRQETFGWVRTENLDVGHAKEGVLVIIILIIHIE